MANPDTLTIAEKLQALGYATLFTEANDPEALSNPSTAFTNVAVWHRGLREDIRGESIQLEERPMAAGWSRTK